MSLNNNVDKSGKEAFLYPRKIKDMLTMPPSFKVTRDQERTQVRALTRADENTAQILSSKVTNFVDSSIGCLSTHPVVSPLGQVCVREREKEKREGVAVGHNGSSPCECVLRYWVQRTSKTRCIFLFLFFLW